MSSFEMRLILQKSIKVSQNATDMSYQKQILWLNKCDASRYIRGYE